MKINNKFEKIRRRDKYYPSFPFIFGGIFLIISYIFIDESDCIRCKDSLPVGIISLILGIGLFINAYRKNR